MALAISGVLREFRKAISYAGRGAAIRTARNQGMEVDIRYENGFTAIIIINEETHVFDVRNERKPAVQRYVPQQNPKPIKILSLCKR